MPPKEDREWYDEMSNKIRREAGLPEIDWKARRKERIAPIVEIRNPWFTPVEMTDNIAPTEWDEWREENLDELAWLGRQLKEIA